MEKLKKMQKEISVFGLVLVVFLALFAYRQLTYKTYKTISSSKLESMLDDKKSFVLVAGSSEDDTMTSFEDIMTQYATKNRSTTIYYLDTADLKSTYISKTLDEDVTLPCTFIIKDGEVTAKKSGALQYYYFYDFIKENA